MHAYVRSNADSCNESLLVTTDQGELESSCIHLANIFATFTTSGPLNNSWNKGLIADDWWGAPATAVVQTGKSTFDNNYRAFCDRSSKLSSVIRFLFTSMETDFSITPSMGSRLQGHVSRP